MARPYSRSTPAGSGGKLTYEPPQWRFDELILGLGHEKEISKKLASRGFARVPPSSILGWRLRNRIPPPWVPIFIQMGLDAKLIKRISDLEKE